MQDRAGEYDAALKSCRQWTRADVAADGKTPEEHEAELERWVAAADARFSAEQARAEEDRAERARHYDRDREQARLALLEVQGLLADLTRQRDECLSGDLSALASDKRRRQFLAGLEPRIAAKAREEADLAAVVGDPETVADANGWLPAERRELALTLFKSRRAAEMRDLRARIAERERGDPGIPQGNTRTRQTPRGAAPGQARLAYLEDMPPLEAPGMCSECVSPAWHTPGVAFDLSGAWTTGGPCPAWPRWAEGVNSVRDVMRQAAQGPPQAEPSPLPQPIAMLVPGAPIEDVIAQLTAIQADHPGAQIRKGKGHRWEIWPVPEESKGL